MEDEDMDTYKELHLVGSIALLLQYILERCARR
jgi:hypothetical protein